MTSLRRQYDIKTSSNKKNALIEFPDKFTTREEDVRFRIIILFSTVFYFGAGPLLGFASHRSYCWDFGGHYSYFVYSVWGGTSCELIFVFISPTVLHCSQNPFITFFRNFQISRYPRKWRFPFCFQDNSYFS